MKYIPLLICLVLFSCPSEEENLIVDPEQSILDCPPEDIAEYPIPDELPDDWNERGEGYCSVKLKTSKEELSFGAQGGVRCITMDRGNFGIAGSYKDCIVEGEQGWNYYKKVKCPWLIATKVAEDDRVLYISVTKNKTKAERNIELNIQSLYCGSHISIIQSAE